MYEKFFGLRERPFDLTPNPRFLYYTARHREALINLEFGIESRKGVVVLIGEAGMGKTTVTRAVIEKQRDAEVQCVYLYNPLLTRAEFIEFLATSLHLSKPAARSKTKLMTELAARLTATRQKGGTVVLLIDEAQSLSDELLEELRMLTNIETHNEKLVTLVLVGQPQLAERLNNERLGQLKQRIELRCTLSPFDLAETAMYIKSRVRTAGGDAVTMFTRDALQAIHERSGGIPRSINVIAENSLIGAFAENQRPVTRALVREVCDEFDLTIRPEEPTIEPRVDTPIVVTSPDRPSVDWAQEPAVPARPAVQPSAGPDDSSSAPAGQPPAGRDTSSSAVSQTGRRWWSFSMAGRRS